MSRPTQYRALLVAMRPHNGLVCGLTLLAGWQGGLASVAKEGFPAAVAVALLCSAAHLVNDLMDLPSDRWNRPGRPLPAGNLDSSLARRAALFCLAAGLALGLIIQPQWWGWWTFWALTGVGYSLFAKGRPLVAPVWTAAVIGSCWLAGASSNGLANWEWGVLGVLVWFLVFRETVKGLEDVRGDLLGGYSSGAGRFPCTRSGLMILGFPLAGLGMVLVMASPGLMGSVTAGIFLVCLGGAMIFILSDGPNQAHSAGSLLKIGAFMGVAQLMAIRMG